MALEGTDLAKLDIRDKYDLIIAYSRRPEDSSENGSRQARSHSENTNDDPERVRVEGEYVFYKGKKYKRVQLDNDRPGEDEDDEYLMDEQGNIYDTLFRLIGRADDDEDDEYQGHLLDDSDGDYFGLDPMKERKAGSQEGNPKRDQRVAAIQKELGDLDSFEDEKENDRLGLFAAIGKPAEGIDSNPLSKLPSIEDSNRGGAKPSKGF